MKFLLDNGADVNLACPCHGYGPIHKVRTIEEAQLLIDYGVNLDVKTVDGDGIVENLKKEIVLEADYVDDIILTDRSDFIKFLESKIC